MQRDRERWKCTGSLSDRKETPASYTAEERETLRRGLRILALLIVRTHMRRQLTGRLAGSERKDKDHTHQCTLFNRIATANDMICSPSQISH